MKSASDKPYIVGLTGGIGSGKSTVSHMFMEMGTQVIDADEISRELVHPGSEALKLIEQQFGSNLLRTDGKLDREKLREIIFVDPMARAWLEQLLHPMIRAEIIDRIESSTKPWLIVSAPLLLEIKDYDFIDTVLIVDTPETAQIARASARDHITPRKVEEIMAAQMTREDRLMHADVIIYNDADLQHLLRQVRALFQQFEEEAREHHKAG